MERRFWPSLLALCALGAVLIVAACNPVAAATQRDGQGGRPSETIRVGFSSAAELGDIPALMAIELLAERGYRVESIFFSSAELSVAALAKGDVQFGHGSTRTNWAAIAKGANITTIMEQAAIAWSLASTVEITSCADLQGKRVGITSNGSLSTALMDGYIQTNCPGTRPNVLLIANSGDRAAALLAGELDASPLETSDMLRMERLAPTRIHQLVDFAATLPTLKTTGVYTNRAFAAEHPEVVSDYLETMLTVHRRIEVEPSLLEAAIARHLGMDREEAARLGGAYLAKSIWNVNGGMDRRSVAESIDLFTRMGSLPPGLNEAGVADLTYLDQVLGKIGRR